MVATCFCPWTLNLHIAIVLLCLRVHYSVENKRYKSQIRIRMCDKCLPLFVDSILCLTDLKDNLLTVVLLKMLQALPLL